MFRLRSVPISLIPLLLTISFGAQAEEARVIVKFKSNSAIRQIQSAGRIQNLADRLGIPASLVSQPSSELHVMKASGISTNELVSRLQTQGDVEYVVPDRLRQARSVPNDPLYSYQWYLQAPTSTLPAAINAAGAWDLSAGLSSIVVAVVDTGVRYDHPDLVNKLLPGYDFVSDDANSGDGSSGRDSDASDPGDYLTSSDLQDTALKTLCTSAGITTTHTSSWHGTMVAGVLAAETGNALGIAGVAGASRILPVRALGKCGGYDSDIIAAVRWAAGLSVPGVPTNPNPARIINLSLGGVGSCEAAYQTAVNEVRALGVLIVAAAGNESGAVEAPGNCSGVLAVGGLRHNGTKVGYSSYGTEVGLSAPAGNCIVSGSCSYPFVSTTNLGSNTPGSNGYTPLYSTVVGTSFSTPLVSGTAALMLALNPSMSVNALSNRLRQTTNAFPTDSSLAACPTTNAEGQCNCTTSTCGSGMLNAQAATQAALLPDVVISGSTSMSSGATVSLSASIALASNASLGSIRWTQVSGPVTGSLSNTTSATAQFSTSTAGTYVLRATAVDSAGRSSSTDFTLSVTGSSDSSSGGGGSADWAWLLGLLGIGVWLRRHPGKF